MDFPILPQEVIQINKQLKNQFGIDTSTAQPMFRVEWSNDQYENALINVTPEGLHLIYPEVRYVRKYGYVQDRWVLANLVAVPETNQKELPDCKVSYEPLFVFEDNKGNATRPTFYACQFIIDTVRAAMGKGNLAKYKDPDSNQEVALENHRKRIDGLTQDLFGDETSVSDHLSRQTGIVVPNSYKGES